MEHILIIGGGMGTALAHDLTLRGFKVSLFEKGDFFQGPPADITVCCTVGRATR